MYNLPENSFFSFLDAKDTCPAKEILYVLADN